jgi:hypothetical protein
MKYRYFARVNGTMVEEMYMAEPNDPICQKFLDQGLIESVGDGSCPGDEWYKQKGEANEL